MTPGESWAAVLLLWGSACLVLGLAGWVLDRLEQRPRRTFDRHAEQAMAMTRPIGPEDRPDWGHQP